MQPSGYRRCLQSGAVSSVQVGVLGPVAVRGGNTDVDVGGHKPRALLVALALAGEQGLDRDQLVAEVWPEDPPASASRSLAVFVSLLRQAFGSTVGRRLIEGDGNSYRLTLLPADEVDADRFVGLLEGLPDNPAGSRGSGTWEASIAKWCWGRCSNSRGPWRERPS